MTIINKKNQNGTIKIFKKKEKVNYNLIAGSIVLIAGFIYNYLERNGKPLGYILFSLPLIIYSILDYFGEKARKNFYFEFNPSNNTITYNKGISKLKVVFDLDNKRLRWEIEEYKRSGKLPYYSATLLAYNGIGKDDPILFDVSDYNKEYCLKTANAISQYITSLSNVKNIDLIELTNERN